MNARDSGHDGAGAAAAIGQLYGCSPRQGALSLTCVALFCAGALLLRRHALIGLFGAILLPSLLGCAALLALARLAGRRLGWLPAWAALAAATAAGTVLALPLYAAWIAAHKLLPLPQLQLLACAFGFSTAVLGLPLWHSQVRARAQQLASLRHAALASELKALQAQVEPHFLYNTLANARYLARKEPERAAQMLEHLIAYLHSALPDMRSRASTLGREFELAGHYLALMAIRFGERLIYTVECPPALRDHPMPPLLLMILVENAVKHGVEPKPGTVRVGLAASRDGATVRVTVSDDGAGTGDATAGGGVGLDNLRRQLDALHGGRASFSLRRTPDGITQALLALPAAA